MRESFHEAVLGDVIIVAGVICNGFVVASVGLATWAVLMHTYYLPRFKRFVQALKVADSSTWAAIGSPDGTMFGSPNVPPWGRRMVKYVWRKQYETLGNEELRLAGRMFRRALIAGQTGVLVWVAVWISLIVLCGRS